MGYVILHFSMPNSSASHTCALPPRQGEKVIRGSKGGEGSEAYVILGLRVPTTSVRARGEVMRASKEGQR